MLSSFVAVEMTSHQNSPLYFDSIPAWIDMALALPVNAGILLSTTEFCWGLPGAVNSKVNSHISFVTFFLQASVFTTVVKSESLNFNIMLL